MLRLFLLLFFVCVPTYAHQLSTAYLQADINSRGVIEGTLQLRLYDLDQNLMVDTDNNGELTWGELQSHRDKVSRFITDKVTFSRGQKACALVVDPEWKIDEHFGEGYVLLPLRAQCGLSGTLELDYRAFFERDSQHKLLVNFGSDNQRENRVISADKSSLRLSSAEGNRLASAGEFIYQGMIHIWMGTDHILFLCALLLPSVLTRRDNRWTAQQDVRAILTNTFWLVTAFTLAHSITLTATALDILHLPSRWVETAIALSVLFAALNNIFPLVLRLGLLTFGFGLLHGMGFAGALGELGIPADQQVLSVLAFNLGVEIGQMAILVAVMPILIVVRNQTWYSRYSLNALSLAISLVAAQWVVQRAFP
jgi:hypothetical protein